MDYCDDCGGLIVPEKKSQQTSFQCRSCGKSYDKHGGELKITEKNEEDKKRINVEEEEADNLPTTDDFECGECGNETAYWWMLQTRAADEPETRFFKCTDCGHTIREYD